MRSPTIGASGWAGVGLALASAVLGGLHAPAWAWVLVAVLAALCFARAYALHAKGAAGPAEAQRRLDALMREGMELLDELMAPAQAEETSKGVWGLSFGDAPDEWWDKTDAFYRQVKDLLTAEHPAWLPEFEKGYNERLRIQRETESVASQQPDNRSNAQKVLDFATDTQRTPAKIVEASLEGLSQVRKAI